MNIYLDRIKPLFESTGLKDAELERQIGIKPKTISKWNANYVKSYDKYIPQIASYFRVSTDYLLGNTDDPTPVGQKETLAENIDKGANPPLYELLTPENQAKVDSYLEFLLAEQQNGQS